MEDFETDYVVIGAGATSLAFVDTMLDTSGASFTLIDRRDKAGGHWNDAYPYVTLHQPSSYYGVASRDLGSGRIDRLGLNKGFEELASGFEVANYFHDLIDEKFLPSGRVKYLPMCEYTEGGQVRNLLSDKTITVTARKKVVDASIYETAIPLTHRRKFEITPGVRCIPPNFLPSNAHKHRHYTILGAGKTAMDSIVWLRENGACPEQITWVMPRDPWMMNRALAQPRGACFYESYGGVTRQLEAGRDATSVDDFAERMEKAGIWMRVDPNVLPKIMHGPTVSKAEYAYLREVKDILRQGHVTFIEPEKLIFKDESVPAKPDTLYVDCTARAIKKHKPWPIFSEGRIDLQMVRLYQPMFSVALLAKLESMYDDDDVKNKLAIPMSMTDTVKNWIAAQIINSTNQYEWSKTPELQAWIDTCRLDGFGRPAREVDPNEPKVRAVMEKIRELMMPALKNMQKLVAE